MLLHAVCILVDVIQADRQWTPIADGIRHSRTHLPRRRLISDTQQLGIRRKRYLGRSILRESPTDPECRLSSRCLDRFGWFSNQEPLNLITAPFTQDR